MKSLLLFFIVLPISLAGCKISYKKSNIVGATVVTQGIFLNAKVCLEGPYLSASEPLLEMSTNLKDDQVLPMATPYASLSPWFHYSFNDHTVTQTIFDNLNIVEWIVVEVYQYENGSYVYKDGQSALVDKNGIIFDTLGIQGISFPTLLPGNYYINILSKNHLSIASEDPTPISASFDENIYNIDFTDPATPYLDEVALTPYVLKNGGLTKCMLAGDTNGSLTILADETGGDTAADGWLLRKDIDDTIVGPFLDNIAIAGYRSTDINLDGQIQRFTDDPGTLTTGTDRQLMLTNDGKVGSIH